MSRKGDCWDNAVAESFFHLLKSELTYHCRWLNYQAADRSLFEYIEIFYNRERSHSTLYYASPNQFEQHRFILLFPLENHLAGCSGVEQREGFDGLFQLESVCDDLIKRDWVS